MVLFGMITHLLATQEHTRKQSGSFSWACDKPFEEAER